MLYFLIAVFIIVAFGLFVLWNAREQARRREAIANLPKVETPPPPPVAPGRLFDAQDAARIAKPSCKQCYGRGIVPTSTDRAPGVPMRDRSGAFMRDKQGNVITERNFVPIYCRCIYKRLPENVIAWNNRYYLIEEAKTKDEAINQAAATVARGELGFARFWRDRVVNFFKHNFARVAAFMIRHGGRAK